MFLAEPPLGLATVVWNSSKFQQINVERFKSQRINQQLKTMQAEDFYVLEHNFQTQADDLRLT